MLANETNAVNIAATPTTEGQSLTYELSESFENQVALDSAVQSQKAAALENSTKGQPHRQDSVIREFGRELTNDNS